MKDIRKHLWEQVQALYAKKYDNAPFVRERLVKDSEKAGMPITTGLLQRIEKQTTDVRFSSLENLALFFDISVSDLTDLNKVNQDEVNYVAEINYPRVIGTAMMGNNGYYYDLEGGDGYIEVKAANGSIAIKVRGDSMHPAIRDGWFVIIEPNTEPKIGEYVLASFIDGKKMVKEFLQEKEDCYVLMSVNGLERITAMKLEINQFQAISVVIPPSKYRDFL